MSVEPLTGPRLEERLGRWCAAAGLDRRSLPAGDRLAESFEAGPEPGPCRAPAEPRRVAAWERRYGFKLPPALRAWLLASDGFYRNGPLVHPLTAIGPMIPFARVPDLLVQPESWFELGNPGTETVCIDLGYRWPGGDCPVFASGDDLRGTPPRLIATGFASWFARLLHEGGREYWLEPGFPTLGDPWAAHRCHAPTPPLPERLRPLAPRVRPLMGPGADDRLIAASLGISRGDVEALFRYLQHR